MARPFLRSFITRLTCRGAGVWSGLLLLVSRALWLQINQPSALSVQGTRRQFLAAQRTPAPRQVQVLTLVRGLDHIDNTLYSQFASIQMLTP